MKLNSVRVKVVALILSALALIVGASLSVSVRSQRANLLEATRRTLFTNTEILNRAIRGLMVKGEAPIAVDTMASLAQIPEFSGIGIYRTDGSIAFNDYATVDFVNAFQKKYIFERTPRIMEEEISGDSFKEVLRTNAPVAVEDFSEKKTVDYYYPILNNEASCRSCHGDPKAGAAFIRGVAYFSVSVDGTIKRIANATIYLSAIFAAIGILFALALLWFMRRLILSPLKAIGGAVREIGEGNLDARAPVASGDELGDLASKINDMIKGLNERFHLSKYVSRSTEDLVVRGGEGPAGGERKRITVLFSDIRGFTSYAENAEPEVVIKALNEVLEAQAEIVERYGGDIDKFVGDELMARFDDEWAAARCAVDLVRAVRSRNAAKGDGLLIGVGINSGEVVAGNIGSKKRMEYAVIGDAINLAARLCGLAKPNMVLISEAVKESLGDAAETVLIAAQKIKGKARAIDIYAIKSLKKT